MYYTSFGCSFILGTDLQGNNIDDVVVSPSDLTWPSLCAQKNQAQYICHAAGGVGNLSIMDKVMLQASAFPSQFFIIGWTYIDRFDYSHPEGFHFNTGEKRWATLLPGVQDPLHEMYYRHLHSEYRDKLCSLIYIKTTIDYLNSKKIKFLMTSMDDLLFCEKYHAPQSVRDLQQGIAPYIHTFEGLNFLDWSRQNGFAISSANHPLEHAHQAAADLMIPVIDAILHKA